MSERKEIDEMLYELEVALRDTEFRRWSLFDQIREAIERETSLARTEDFIKGYDEGFEDGREELAMKLEEAEK